MKLQPPVGLTNVITKSVGKEKLEGFSCLRSELQLLYREPE